MSKYIILFKLFIIFLFYSLNNIKKSDYDIKMEFPKIQIKFFSTYIYIYIDNMITSIDCVMMQNYYYPGFYFIWQSINDFFEYWRSLVSCPLWDSIPNEQLGRTNVNKGFLLVAWNLLHAYSQLLLHMPNFSCPYSAILRQYSKMPLGTFCALLVPWPTKSLWQPMIFPTSLQA